MDLVRVEPVLSNLARRGNRGWTFTLTWNAATPRQIERFYRTSKSGRGLQRCITRFDDTATTPWTGHHHAGAGAASRLCRWVDDPHLDPAIAWPPDPAGMRKAIRVTFLQFAIPARSDGR